MSTSRGLYICVVSFIGSLIAAPARAEVFVVAPSGTPYKQIWQALPDAENGDIVLVRSGDYDGFYLQQKGIAVIADAGAVVNVGQISVYGVPDSEQLTLVGLNPALPAAGLELTHCVGSVRVVDCSFGGSESFHFASPSPPAYAWQCADVAFTRCRLAGVDDHVNGGSTAMHIEGSVVTFADTTIRGGVGADGSSYELTGHGNTPGLAGKPALYVKNSTVFLTGSTLVGGHGGKGVAGVCNDPERVPTRGGQGGPGVTVFDVFNGPDSFLRDLDSVVEDAAGGAGGTSPCGNAPDGAIGGGFGDIDREHLVGKSRTLYAIAPAREGESFRLHFEGEEGDRVFLLTASYAAQSYDPFFHGQTLLLPPLRRLFCGVVGAGGVLDVHLPVPDLDSGIDGHLLHGQGMFIDVDGLRWLSGTSPVLTLDENL